MSIKDTITVIHRRWADSAPRERLVRGRAAAAARLLPQHPFWYGQYPHTFLERVPPADLGGPSELPRVIWAFWTGRNEMSAARSAGLRQLIDVNHPLPVVLVTADNLEQFLVDGHPLHPAYENLSNTHRSDYLRAYFLHHHGGGYSDIKPMTASWESHFTAVDREDTWLMGPALTSPYQAGGNRGRLGIHLRRYHRRLVTGSAMVARSHTPLTAEWLREVERMLTYLAPALAEHPREESDPGYPLEWTDLLAAILQPLLLKHAEHVRIDPEPWWDAKAHYR